MKNRYCKGIYSIYCIEAKQINSANENSIEWKADINQQNRLVYSNNSINI